MGLAILFQPKQKSEFKIADIFWLLALFGIIHGTNEFLDMWAIIESRHTILDVVRWFILYISYIFLFEFGRQLYVITALKSPVCRHKIVKLLGWWLSPIISVIIVIIVLTSSDLWKIGSIFTRYFLGFPGGLLICYGFYSYYKCEKKLLEPLKVKKYFLIGGFSFLIYGILGGTVVPKADFFPSNVLNTDSFLSTVKIPVQAFRTICAMTAAWAVAGILKIFNWEIKNKLQIYQKRLRATMSKLSIVEEQERKRISEELHDNISQNLALSKIRLASLQESCPEISKELSETRDLIDQTIKFTRSLIFDLSPPILYELGFKAAIEWLTEQIQGKYGIIVEFTSDAILEEPKKETSVLLFKTVRELLINVVKHAHAQKTIVNIKSKGSSILVNVEDNGVGFNTDTIEPYFIEDGGFGILNIRERIQYLGGSFEITSKEGQGTRVSISVPIQK